MAPSAAPPGSSQRARALVVRGQRVRLPLARRPARGALAEAADWEPWARSSLSTATTASGRSSAASAASCCGSCATGTASVTRMYSATLPFNREHTRHGSRSRAATRTAAPARTFSRAARRAGKIAATMPTTIVAIAKTISCPTGSEKTMKSTRADEQRAEHDPEHDADHAADQRGDHALVADHPAHLAPRHADRAQHPELARALEDRQHERVHDPEQADDRPTARAARRGRSGSRSAPPIWLSMNSCFVCTFAFGNGASCCSSAALFASVSPPCIRTNEKMFCGLVVDPVPRRVRDRHAPERRAAGRRVEDAAHLERQRRRRSARVSVERRADRRGRGSSRSPCRRSRRARRGPRAPASEPSTQLRLKMPTACGLTAGRLDRLAEHLRVAAAHVRDRLDARRLGRALPAAIGIGEKLSSAVIA